MTARTAAAVTRRPERPGDAELQERAGARPVRLSVWSGNTGARRLYGFRAVPSAGEGYVEMTWRR